MQSNSRPPLAALIIMDGLALNPDEKGNAVQAAAKPHLDRLMKEYPSTTLMTCGRDVGLMEGQMGDSNVGHLNLGAGRIVKQYVLRILDAIDDGTFFDRPALTEAVDHVKKKGGTLHVVSLVSTGGVHAHSRIALACVQLAKERGVSDVAVHALMDGRDTPPDSGLRFMTEFQSELAAIGVGRIASVSGRYFAMDRDRRFDRTHKAYDAIALGSGTQGTDPLHIIQHAYDKGETDEFITPTVVVDDDGAPVGRIRPGDAVLFANFRADRARQLVSALIDPDFDGFPRTEGLIPVHMTTMTEYDASFGVPFAFEPQNMSDLLGEVVAAQGWRQMRVAETEKYAHVTYFFNGGIEEPFVGEDRRLIPSPQVATYDLQPEMSAAGVADAALEAIQSEAYQLLVVNFANCDMVGHTGDFDAAVKAVETVDHHVGRLVKAILAVGGSAVVTADHGNADQMIDYDTGGPHTFHTLHPVPCVLASRDGNVSLREGILADVAPTMLDLLGVEKPAAMTGESLIERN